MSDEKKFPVPYQQNDLRTLPPTGLPTDPPTMVRGFLVLWEMKLADMVRGLGADARVVQRPFNPEGGAYGGKGPLQESHHHHGNHDHGHDHGHDHSHDHHHAPPAKPCSAIIAAPAMAPAAPVRRVIRCWPTMSGFGAAR